jgi:hypothetical protein
VAYSVTLLLPNHPDPRVLVDLANVHARATADWYLRQWRLGYEPPSSALLAGCRWSPVPGRSDLTFRSAREVFTSGRGDCWEFAAISAGHKQGHARRNGMDPDYAATQFYVDLEDGTDPDPDPSKRTADYFHAVVRSPYGTEDPTKA